MLLKDRIQVGEVVELRWRTQRRDLDSVHIVAALAEVTARVGVCEVGAEPELVQWPVRPLEPNGRATEPVVVPDEHAVVIEVLAGEIERGAVVAAGNGHGVLSDVTGLVQLAGVVEDREAGGERSTPRTSTHAVPRVVARTARGRVRLDAESSLAEVGLERHEVTDVVERGGGAVGEVRRASPARLGSNEDHALAGPRAVDGACRRAL